MFYLPLEVLDAAGASIIAPCRQSIAAILLIAIHLREIQIVGLLHPEAAYAFNPALLPKVPFVQIQGQCTPTHIATEWIHTDSGERVAAFSDRRIEYFSWPE